MASSRNSREHVIVDIILQRTLSVSQEYGGLKYDPAALRYACSYASFMAVFIGCIMRRIIPIDAYIIVK